MSNKPRLLNRKGHLTKLGSKISLDIAQALDPVWNKYRDKADRSDLLLRFIEAASLVDFMATLYAIPKEPK